MTKKMHVHTGWIKTDSARRPHTLGCETTEGSLHRLSPLCAIVPNAFGIWFGVDASWVTGTDGKGSKSVAAWRKYLAERFSQTKLADTGFELQGKSLFLPIRVDAQVLAENYPDSLDEALAPVDDALKKLEVAHPEIDGLLRAAQEYSFAK